MPADHTPNSRVSSETLSSAVFFSLRVFSTSLWVSWSCLSRDERSFCWEVSLDFSWSLSPFSTTSSCRGREGHGCLIVTRPTNYTHKWQTWEIESKKPVKPVWETGEFCWGRRWRQSWSPAEPPDLWLSQSLLHCWLLRSQLLTAPLLTRGRTG